MAPSLSLNTLILSSLCSFMEIRLILQRLFEHSTGCSKVIFCPRAVLDRLIFNRFLYITCAYFNEMLSNSVLRSYGGKYAMSEYEVCCTSKARASKSYKMKFGLSRVAYNTFFSISIESSHSNACNGVCRNFCYKKSEYNTKF